MMYRLSFLLVFCLSILLPNTGRAGIDDKVEYEKNRAKLLSYIISKQLSKNHYSHKKIDDQLSTEAFDLYLKQLDPQKRFFLKSDVEKLSVFKLDLDDQMNSGNIEFPIIAENILKERVAVVEKMTGQIIEDGFDLNKDDLLETDAKKLSYCDSEKELKERWRKSLKYQFISRYLTMRDEQAALKELAEKGKESGDGKEVKYEEKTDSQLLADAKEKILKGNHNLFKRIMQRDVQDQYDRYFSVITRAFDPHSDFMPPQNKEDFDIHMRGSLEGIGAVLQEEDGYIKVVRIIPGGAAARQKALHAEDIILMVAQEEGDPVDIVDMRIREAVALIRGKKGTAVHLTVKKPDGTINNLKIIRDVVQLEETFVKSVVLPADKEGRSYGYMKIPSFYRDFSGTKNGGKGRNVTEDVLNDLDELAKKNISGLILDLRNNGGGALVDAVKTAGLFIKNGPIVQVKTSDEQADVLYDYDPDIHYKGPIVVLVNKFSASASEILAGALQDYNRALIVGADHSYGKGTVQTLVNLDDNIPFMSINMSKYKPIGALKMTTQKFYRINGESTQHKGVVPDIILPDRFKYVEAGEQYLENSMEWDKISPTSHNNWSALPDVELIRKNSDERVVKNEDFIEITKEAEDSKKRQQETILKVSLQSIEQEMQRIKEMNSEKNYAEIGHGMTGQSSEGQDENLSAEEEEKKFVEELREDPYVEESLFLLGDIAS